jgi:hypothetical protein
MPRTIARRWNAHRQAERIGLGLGQVPADRQLAALIINQHRHPERQRRKALPFTFRKTSQRRVLDEHGQIANLQIADVEAIDARQLQAAQPDFTDARAERVGNRADVGALSRVA